MANVVKLYYTGRTAATEWELVPSKLLVVEDIESYLATKTALTINNFQYVKNEMEIGINVDIAESYSQPKSTLNFKYVSIQNDSELTHYYYVKKAIWRSKTCVRFELVMDVLNTFQEGIDYNFKKNTRIIREHRDRISMTTKNVLFTFDSVYGSTGQIRVGDTIEFCTLQNPETAFKGLYVREVHNPQGLWFAFTGVNTDDLQEWITDNQEDIIILKKNAQNYVGFNGFEFVRANFQARRIVDYIPENINPILQCGDGKGTYIEDISPLNQDWYLLYRNQNDPTEALVNPVECYLIPEKETAVNLGSIQSNGRVNPDNLEYGKYYYFHILKEARYQSEVKSVILSNGSNYSTHVGSSMTTYEYYYFIVYKASDDKITIITRVQYQEYGQAEVNYLLAVETVDYFQVAPLPFTYYISTSFNASGEYPSGSTSAQWTSEGTTQFNIDSIDKLDKTDAKNIKLIKLPYIPYNFNVVNDVLILTDTDFEHISLTQSGGGVIEILRLTNLNTSLGRKIPTSDYINPFSNFILTTDPTFTPVITDLRITNMQLESKIFNSEFYLPKLVYDSFVYNIELEKLDQAHFYTAANNYFEVEFTMTKTINSKFLFTITSIRFDYCDSNYADCLPVARNNEEVLYNVPYINYVRTGYNYDVKNKNISMASNIAGLGFSAVSIGASLLAPSVPLKIAGVVASLVSLAMSVKSTITTTIQNENSIKQKILQTQNQASSVAGSDDVDLMSKYAGNRLKYLVYEPTPIMKNLLEDLFFYAGYNTNRLGLPSHNTRINFDYLECEASLEKISSIPDECMTELINCFKNGITYLHKTNRTTDKWDFEQKYENWERSVI